jgi:multicomponent Na+:H+ antiporter subunit D
MTGTSALCVLLGLAPEILYRLLPGATGYVPYTAEHVVMSIQLLVGTAVGFALIESRLRAKAMVTLDFDRLYRTAGRWIAHGVGLAVARLADALEAVVLDLAVRTMAQVRNRTARPVGYAVLLVVVALGLGLTLFRGIR